MIQLYEAYDAQCQREGVCDFSELLLRSYELLKHNEIIRTHYQERFHPDRIAGRILEMGDLATLAEIVRDAGGDPRAPVATKSGSGVPKGEMTFSDLLEQLRQMSSMGPIGQIVKMIPGMGGVAAQAEEAVAAGELKRAEAIILSMTPTERENPSLLSIPRRRRIAAGAGRATCETMLNISIKFVMDSSPLKEPPPSLASRHTGKGWEPLRL